MPFTIAVSGKGGTGKTTLSALMLRRLVESGVKPVLAVDADPNATLGLTIGLPPTKTLSDVREDTLSSAREMTAMSKDDLFEMGLYECLEEGKGFDLITMGRPEGPKCYCYVNSVLRRQVNRVKEKYAAVLMDNEAGMEHLSRLTTHDVDVLVLVSEPTRIGLLTVARIRELAESLPIKVGHSLLMVNRVRSEGIGDRLAEHIRAAGFARHFALPRIDEIEQLSEDGDPLSKLTDVPSGIDALLEACHVPGFAPTPRV
jgi:CO dehydrogenase maturation factor